MDGVRLLAEAREAGLLVQADGDTLRIRGPRRLGTLARQLLHNKSEVLALLQGHPVPQPAQHPQNGPVSNAVDNGNRAAGCSDAPAREHDPEVPHELSLAERVESGYVNPGWTAQAWADRLCQLAERCEVLRPELAAQYRRWAANVRKNERELA